MKKLLTITTGIALLAAGTVNASPGAAGHHSGQNMQSEQMGGNPHHQQMMEQHGTSGHAHEMESLAGTPGSSSDVSREIAVAAEDLMRFMHEPIIVKDGETIKFVVTNNGVIPHEFAIATKDEHMEHGQMMMNNPDMQHGPGGNAITVKPGETQELIWKFENAWQVEVACNIPGHYKAGMHSHIDIEE